MAWMEGTRGRRRNVILDPPAGRARCKKLYASCSFTWRVCLAVCENLLHLFIHSDCNSKLHSISCFPLPLFTIFTSAIHILWRGSLLDDSCMDTGFSQKQLDRSQSLTKIAAKRALDKYGWKPRKIGLMFLHYSTLKMTIWQNFHKTMCMRACYFVVNFPWAKLECINFTNLHSAELLPSFCKQIRTKFASAMVPLNGRVSTQNYRTSLTKVVPILHFRLHFTFHRSRLKAFKSFLMTSFVCLFSVFSFTRKNRNEISSKQELFSDLFW